MNGKLCVCIWKCWKTNKITHFDDKADPPGVNKPPPLGGGGGGGLLTPGGG